jgi:hypothetical protein
VPLNMLDVLIKSKIYPVVEFSLIISLIIVTYWGMHVGGFTRIRPAAKFSVSMLLGSFAYMAGKMVVIALFAGASPPETAYAF